MVLYVQRRVPRHGGAVAIVIGWATLVFIGLAFSVRPPAGHRADPLLDPSCPWYVREAADGTGQVGELVRRFHLQTWVAQNSPKLKSAGDDPSPSPRWTSARARRRCWGRW